MNVVLNVFKRFFLERFHDESALMAYYFMLAIFPFLVFSFAIISLLPVQSEDVLTILEPYIPKGSFSLIEDNIMGIVGRNQTKLASFSLLAAFWIASMAVQALVRSMNEAYRVIREESFFLALGKDLILTAGLMITLTVSLLIPIGEEISRVFLVAHLPSAFYHWWAVVKWGIGSIYLLFFFLLLYKTVPSSKIRFSHALPGAIFSTIGWQTVTIGFTYYVSYFASYTKLYGYMANMIVLMIWFYFTAAVLLIGGLINASWIDKHA
ncbi:YihY/virulence factor BrkB family protein [Lederbergia ruris]|uniref:Ribonuclease-like protein YfkH n=1 Tax=Lederbergia ruris TaxID=217495 RepID=A0ABQ4KE99_9BACI|nr:YihY/virulence factor BrkB family protein [Lederbergia ruris]GIN56300.1 putative ribonuclease-like protein YfkH [Lederbergia ruris]